MKYAARSASDKTDNWPLWMVVNEAGVNVLKDGQYYGGKFDTRERCEEFAREMNA